MSANTLVFGGRRLSQEHSERRADIEKRIDEAFVADVNVFTRLFRGRTPDFRFDLNGTTNNADSGVSRSDQNRQQAVNDAAIERSSAEVAALEEQRRRNELATNQLRCID